MSIHSGLGLGVVLRAYVSQKSCDYLYKAEVCVSHRDGGSLIYLSKDIAEGLRAANAVWIQPPASFSSLSLSLLPLSL